MLHICRVCTTRFAPADRCPHCGSTDYVEEGQEMPKTTVNNGPSYEGEPREPVHVGEQGSEVVHLPDGSVVEHQAGDVGHELSSSGDGAALPEAVEGDDTEREAGPERPDYASLTVETLRGYLADRELSTVGLKAELVERLEADDAEQDGRD